MTRAQRWQVAVSGSRKALSYLHDGLAILQEVQKEYIEEHEARGLAGKPLDEELEAVTYIDVDETLSAVRTIDMILSEAQALQLPQEGQAD